jgi:hypothetical protein
MKKVLLALLSLLFFLPASGQIDQATYDKMKQEILDSLKKELGIVEEPTYEKIPFDHDFSWMNGNNRQKSSLIHGKNWNLHMIFDMYVNFNNHLPIDHTENTSSTIGRTGEFTINTATLGFEYTYKKVFARFSLQTGSMLSVIQHTDNTINHGRNLRTDDLKFIREAVLGYKINKLYGVTLEAGMFMSFIGTESYNTQENWCYQRAMVVDFTPFYFLGFRSQINLTKDFKIEPWIMNGWYSYGMFNHRPSYGMCITYRPKEWMGWVANFYVGSDTKLTPDRIRAHSDLSVQVRYINRPEKKGLSKAAFHVNGQYGFEDGGFDTSGIALPTFRETYFAGVSASNRFWFYKDHIGLTLRGGFVKNPGRYLPFVPTAYGYIDNPTNDPRKDFFAWELTSTLDFMINDYFTIRLEYLYRKANLPYFAGPGGTTAPDGWQPTDPTWTPDLSDEVHRWLVNFNVRF